VTKLVDQDRQLTETGLGVMPNDRGYRRSFDAIDAAVVIVRHKFLLVKIGLVTAGLTAIVVFLLPNIYIAETVILPPRQSQSLTASMLGQLAPLAGLVGKDLGSQNSSELYVTMLKSRTVADAIVRRFSLTSYYGSKNDDDARAALLEDSDINARKDGVIVIDVENKDPKRAAEIANAYVEELKELNSQLAFSEASRRRLFFDKERTDAKQQLTTAEAELQKEQEKSGLIQLDSQSKAIIESVAAARAQVAASEVRLDTIKSFATDENPDLKREEQRLAGLRAQLAQLERGQSGEVGDIMVPTGKVPAAGLAYLQRFRDVKYAETLFDLLSKEYEVAKIDEARESAIVQTIDPAKAPEHKSKPKRLLTTLFTTLIVVFLTMGWLLIRAVWTSWTSDPETKDRVAELLAG